MTCGLCNDMRLVPTYAEDGPEYEACPRCASMAQFQYMPTREFLRKAILSDPELCQEIVQAADKKSPRSVGDSPEGQLR